MLYVKTQLNDQIEIKIDIYEDEIFTTCPTCGKEHQVEPNVLVEIINQGADFAGTNIYCNSCYQKAGDLNANHGF